ncbi:MAG: hypothetical protein AB2L14_18740 [Candidatus Xenobiia bacterium LiM19]
MAIPIRMTERLQKILVYSEFSIPPLGKALAILVLLVNIIGIYIIFNIAEKMMNSFPGYSPPIYNKDVIKSVLLTLILFSCGFGMGVGIIAGAFIECLRSKKLRESLRKAKEISTNTKENSNQIIE